MEASELNPVFLSYFFLVFHGMGLLKGKFGSKVYISCGKNAASNLWLTLSLVGVNDTLRVSQVQCVSFIHPPLSASFTLTNEELIKCSSASVSEKVIKEEDSSLAKLAQILWRIRCATDRDRLLE